MIRNFIIALLLLGIVFPSGSLDEFKIDVDTICKDTTEINLVTVLDEDDDPVENASVKVEDINPWKQIKFGIANSSGQYEFTACDDTYNITASYGGFESKTITYTLPKCNECTASTPPPAPEQKEEDEPEDTTVAPAANTTSPPANVTPPPATSQPPPSASTAETSAPASNENEEKAEDQNQKKPLPCCASAAILIFLSLLAVKTQP